jgi:hypothetical protein
MKRSLLFVVSLFAITLFPGPRLAAQVPAQDPDKCDYPIHRGREIDRKTKILDKPEPAFTAKERREHARQIITLTALFCGSGEVVQIRVKTGISDKLDAKAIEAAKKIQFIPGEKNGTKISQELILAYYVQNY